MKNRILLSSILFLVVFSIQNMAAQSKKNVVASFEKIIISPHVEAVLKQGAETAVTINKSKISEDKLNVEVEGNTLRVYLDGAKMVTKSERVAYGRKPIYQGTMLTVTITYKTLKNLSVRGEEVVTSESLIDEDELKLSIYGEAKVYFNAVTLNELNVAIYGESYLEVKDGMVKRQVYRAYGESEVNTLEMNNDETKITAYGESNFRINVSDRLKVTCYGETSINYKGNATVDKGIVIGEASLRKIG